MSDRDFLTMADVLGLQTVLMERYGGAPGVRDPGALEAALFRPQTFHTAHLEPWLRSFCSQDN